MFRLQNEMPIAQRLPRSGGMKYRATNMKNPIASMPYTPIIAPWP